jgi:hypothetical protein
MGMLEGIWGHMLHIEALGGLLLFFSFLFSWFLFPSPSFLFFPLFLLFLFSSFPHLEDHLFAYQPFSFFGIMILHLHFYS